ncbi:Aminoglycoside phosphotransferase [Penicillium cf. griseofulvum]|uniref:Aminoglycoside phosphotransferase n=1 Tax=Penicillium cf. griseofulvum TaxID=2972120 RepID=A0A9W9J3G0_9EURO|nr:Aminoglycoside phosphotransferase [Penicillium cf. griseofulvum]KAJ5427848.1 Aminoglycoside phosphotransferase [Penicillium cf. griseofulvum]
MVSQESQAHGLMWVEETFGSEPRWTVEPDIRAITETVQSLRPSSTVEVTFLAQGGFNKIYDVSIDEELSIMRVSLPVDPRFKVMSEVTTMDWVCHITSLPIPRVITYQPSRNNLIGFEWILMTKMPGQPFREDLQSLSFDVKARLVRELAASSAALFQNQLRGIGNIYGEPSVIGNLTSSGQTPPSRELADIKLSVPAKESDSDDGSVPIKKNPRPLFGPPNTGSSEGVLPVVGRIVSMQFFWDLHIHQDIHRGPFRSSKDWIIARLLFNENDCHSALNKHSVEDPDSDDEDEVKDATRTLKIIDNLRALLPLVFPTDDDDPEPSIIFHDDLSQGNILVDDSGKLTGVLDWECVSAVPLWKGCDYPPFLEERPRRQEPVIGRYKLEDNGEPSELYFEHLWQYEATLLRDIFIDEMRRLDAGWVEVFDKSQIKRDFDYAVHHCDCCISARHIEAWIGDMAAGISNPRSLENRIYSP